MFYARLVGISTIGLVMLLSCSSLYTYAGERGNNNDGDLNMMFLQGTQYIPSVLQKGIAFPVGQYYVDVFFNKENLGKSVIVISPEEEKSGSLCLTAEWLHKTGIPVNLEAYSAVYNSQRGCYKLADSKYTTLDFDYSTQSLMLSVPQINVINKTDPKQWDFGVDAFRFKYRGNAIYQNNHKTSIYGSGDIDINISRWVLSSHISASRLNAGQSDFFVHDATLSTALGALHSDLRLGKSSTRNDLFSDFGFYGATLRSNSNMLPQEARGYAPLISGVAATTSRITILQNGYTVYSRVVQPGPYELNDVRPVGNGDLEVIVEDSSGRRTVNHYPVTTLPTLLRPGELQYDVSVGRKSSASDITKAFSSHNKGIFGAGSLAYGIGDTTFSVASILHPEYCSGGVSVTKSLGGLGAFAVSGTLAQAEYDNKYTRRGHSLSAKYAKVFAETTDLHLMAYRYQSKGYVEFANFDPKERNNKLEFNQKSRYEMRLTQRLPGYTNLNLTAWREDYWARSGHAVGGMLSTGFTLFDNVSLSLNAGYSKNPYHEKAEYTGSLGVSVPFGTGSIHHYTNSSVGYNSVSGAQYWTSVMSYPTEDLNYSVGVSATEKGGRNASANLNYSFDTIQAGIGVSQDRHNTSVNADFSGAVVATAESGFLLTRDQSDAVGVVRVPNVPGVRFNGSPKTNNKGYTVVGLSDYSQNRIDVDMENVPSNLEMDITSYNVVPTEKAVVYREFGANYVKRYILRVRGKDGKILSGGNARTEHGVDAGFIARNGVLSMSLLNEPENIKVDLGNMNECHISMKGIKPGAGQVHEVHCE
ncbi:PefC/AfrB family outer membrane usher protein [Escherichia coli]|uniref:PefC/AfrB family outer membrane usher protein n=1 Tax=Escherichia coli TaxID=562 RepID=UPI0039790972